MGATLWCMRFYPVSVVVTAFVKVVVNWFVAIGIKAVAARLRIGTAITGHALSAVDAIAEVRIINAFK